MRCQPTAAHLPLHASERPALVGVAQIDLTRGAILLREHCLEMPVEAAFEALCPSIGTSSTHT